jgi:acetylornithine/succinyldiaminopimelate/putrescine aminotransferase
MEMLEEGALMQRVGEVGVFFRKRLRRLQRALPDIITEVRGQGLMVGLQLAFNGKGVVTKMLERGFLLNCTHDVVLRLLPPYLIRKAEISSMITALEEVLVEEAALAARSLAAGAVGAVGSKQEGR